MTDESRAWLSVAMDCYVASWPTTDRTAPESKHPSETEDQCGSGWLSSSRWSWWASYSSRCKSRNPIANRLESDHSDREASQANWQDQ